MTLEIFIRLCFGVVFVAANAFFVATEFAFTRARQFKKGEFDENSGLRTAWKMTQQLEIYLTGCQVGITFTSILLGIVVEPAVTELLKPLVGLFSVEPATARTISIIGGVVGLNLIHTVWAEQTPTYLGIERSKLVLTYCARPLKYWTWLVYPLLCVGDLLAKQTLRLCGIEMTRSWITEEDNAADTADQQSSPRIQLNNQVAALLQKSDLSETRKEEVLRSITIDDMKVTDIMVNRKDIVALRNEDQFESIAQLIGKSKFSRYPLIGSDLEDSLGTIYLPEIFDHLADLQAGKKSLLALATESLFVNSDVSVSKLIDIFQENHQEIALVRSNSSEVIGLVTFTDAAEATFGALEDPLDLKVANVP